MTTAPSRRRDGVDRREAKGTETVTALARPNVSIVVLAIPVGVFFVAYGLFSFVAGLRLLNLHHALKRSEAKVARDTGTGTAKETRHAA
jgi:hypothetical protein